MAMAMRMEEEKMATTMAMEMWKVGEERKG